MLSSIILASDYCCPAARHPVQRFLRLFPDPAAIGLEANTVTFLPMSFQPCNLCTPCFPHRATCLKCLSAWCVPSCPQAILSLMLLPLALDPILQLFCLPLSSPIYLMDLIHALLISPQILSTDTFLIPFLSAIVFADLGSGSRKCVPACPHSLCGPLLRLFCPTPPNPLPGSAVDGLGFSLVLLPPLSATTFLLTIWT